jgi:hypothetical protein
VTAFKVQVRRVPGGIEAPTALIEKVPRAPDSIPLTVPNPPSILLPLAEVSTQTRGASWYEHVVNAQHLHRETFRFA